MSDDSFILVFRPHQVPAWAEDFQTEQDFIDAWINGEYDRKCSANYLRYATENGLEDEEGNIIREPTIEDAIADVGHDLHALTRLDSAEEVDRYVNDREYAGHHNKATGQVLECAIELGWIEEEEEEDEDEDE